MPQAMESTPEEEGEDEETRVRNLSEAIRLTVFTWVARGLFEEHKLIFLCQLTFELMKTGVVGADTGFSFDHLQLLIRGVSPGDEESDIDWLPDIIWSACTALSLVSPFETFASDLQSNAPRFMEWFVAGGAGAVCCHQWVLMWALPVVFTPPPGTTM